MRVEWQVYELAGVPCSHQFLHFGTTHYSTSARGARINQKGLSLYTITLTWRSLLISFEVQTVGSQKRTSLINPRL
jgi:hypothetical protein